MEKGIVVSVNSRIESHDAGLFVSGGQPIRTSFVHDSYELLFVRTGSVTVIEDGKDYHVGTNRAFIVYPGSDHGVDLSRAEEVSFYWVLFDADPPVTEQCEPEVRVPKEVSVHEPERLVELFHRFLDDQRSERLTKVMGAHLIGLMLCELGYNACESKQPRTKAVSIVDTVKLYISKHYHEPISTRSIADALNYNPDYLERVFHSVTEMSITESIHKKRVKEARRQLIHEYRNISEIAYACGFSDTGYFRRVFKRLTDMTPTKFRGLYSQVHLKVG